MVVRAAWLVVCELLHAQSWYDDRQMSGDVLLTDRFRQVSTANEMFKFDHQHSCYDNSLALFSLHAHHRLQRQHSREGMARLDSGMVNLCEASRCASR